MKQKRIHYQEIERLNPDINFGLNDSQVLERIETGNQNNAPNPTNKSVLAIITSNVFTTLNVLMFVVAAILLLVVGPKVVTNLMFLLIIVINLTIGITQEIKTKRKIEKLKLLADSKITVRRNGKDIQISPNDIVLDDIVILSPGDQIPADCIVLNEDVVEVNESLLTGESLPVKKIKGDMVLAGSFVVSGIIIAIADKIGSNTYLHSIENKAKSLKQPKSKLMISIKRIIHLLTSFAVPLAVAVFLNEFIQSATHNVKMLPTFPSFWGQESLLTDAIFYGGTTIAYMIPCGMALLASVAMATGVIKLAENNTLTSDLYSVELLSRVDTLCLDKTGTLTDGTMTLEDTLIINDNYLKDEISNIISSYLSAFKTNNQTSIALMKTYGNTAVYIPIKKIEFSSGRKYSSVSFDNGTYVLGAPEYLSEDKDLLNKVDEFASHGLRVVMLIKVNEDFIDDDVLPKNRENICLFILRDNIRPEVKETMEWFKNNEVDIKVISGDNVATVSHIAMLSGIANYDKVFDMSKLSEEDDFDEVVMKHTIFGRVSPEQKADIIAVLKKYGRVTGVTGDGLNDLLAFKQADCSIALVNGASATKNVANIILMDSNFAHMKEAVYQGRRVVNNIQRSSSLFVMKDFLWLLITVMPIFLGTQHIIQPTVMTIVNVFITGIASTVISLEPDKSKSDGNFFINVISRATTSAMYMFFPVVIIMSYFILSRILISSSLDISEMKTMFENGEIIALNWLPIMAICVTISGFIIFFNDCRPFTKFRKILFISVTSLVALILYLAPEYFIISGTDMLANTGGIANMPNFIFSHIGSNATFYLLKTLTTEQIIFLVAFIVASYPLFLFNRKVVQKVLEKRLFSKLKHMDD